MITQTRTTPSPSNDASRRGTAEERTPHDAASERQATPPSPAGAGRDAAFAGEVHDWNDTRDRYEMIAEAAYFKAEKRGFALGEEELDWLEAEQELIEAMEGDRVVEET